MKLLNVVLCVVFLVVMCGCACPCKKFCQPEVARYAWVAGLKAERADYYKKLHANPWPAVSKKITECNIRNYSIYVREIEGKLYLFSYLEYIGKDFDADMKKMAADPETQKWWKETDPCQAPLPDALAKKGIWSDVTEIFHQR